MLVDMHAHVIPGALEAVGSSEDHRGPRIGPCDDPQARLLQNDRGMQFKASEAFYSAERRLEEQDRSGVDAEIVSPMPPLLDYGLPGSEGLELSRRVNEFIAELCRADPGRLLGMAMVPMQASELAPAELARIKDMGLVAVEIASNVLGRSLHEDEFAEFWAEAERLEIPIFVHGMPSDLGGRVPAGLVPVAGFAVGADCALAATAIISGGVAEKHPALRLAFSHGAGGIPMHASTRQLLLGQDLERGALIRGRGRVARGVREALLLRRPRDGPADAAPPDRDDGPHAGARRVGLPGDAARGSVRAHAALAGAGAGGARGHHLAQRLPLPRH